MTRLFDAIVDGDPEGFPVATGPALPRHRTTARWLAALPLRMGILAVILAGGGLFSPADATAAEALPPEISVAEAAAMRDDGVLALDVREPHEWVESHIPGATLIPLGELAARVDEIPRDRKIVVVCRSGNRSAKGRDILLAAGFRQVANMAGGIIQWKAAGFPTVSGP